MRPYLKLVSSVDTLTSATAGSFEQLQVPLLPSPVPTLSICSADALDATLLVTLVGARGPAALVDFRTAPRFDFGDLNRRKLFALLEDTSSRYFDLGSKVTEDVSQATEVISATASISKGKYFHSLIVLLDAHVEFERFGVAAVQNLRTRTNREWELLLFGPMETAPEERDILFINHANPEDNDFALWLQIQLTRLGYTTWSDLTDIRGGEHHWDTIEDVIRNRAIRVISVVSKASLTKPGVLDEISLAISVERSRQLKNFVVPLRIQDIPFGDFRANVARKNIIDFTHGWTNGLSVLARTLAADGVPRQAPKETISVASWWIRNRNRTQSLVRSPEVLQSNRFQVIDVPRLVHFYRDCPNLGEGRLAPFARLGRNWASFCSPDELIKIGIYGMTADSTISTEKLFPGLNALSFGEVDPEFRGRFHYLLNSHWNSFATGRGLRLYRESGTYPVTYFPDGLVPGNTVQFVDHEGASRKRLVVGCSIKRNLYWHLAPFCSFSSSDNAELNVRMRVLFSEDGQQDWLSVDRMKRVRRAFCKNWWNDRWRSLQQAFIAWLSEHESSLKLFQGENGGLIVKTQPVGYRCALSIDEELLANSDLLESTAPSTDHDDNDDWSAVDELLHEDLETESTS